MRGSVLVTINRGYINNSPSPNHRIVKPSSIILLVQIKIGLKFFVVIQIIVYLRIFIFKRNNNIGAKPFHYQAKGIVMVLLQHWSIILQYHPYITQMIFNIIPMNRVAIYNYKKRSIPKFISTSLYIYETTKLMGWLQLPDSLRVFR